MPATPDDLFAFLDSLGIVHKTVTHPPLFTVEQSQALRGTIPGGHTKNLFLKDKKDTVFLVTAPEDARVDLKTLHHKLGAGRFSFGSAALLEELLGVPPGAVTPFGAINDKAGRVTVVVDAGLMQHAVINCHPLVNTMTTSIASNDLIKFLEATGQPAGRTLCRLILSFELLGDIGFSDRIGNLRSLVRVRCTILNN